jgi:hypothetical protein
MKVYVFGGADRYEYFEPLKGGDVKVDEQEIRRSQEKENVRNRQREISGSLAMILVGLPLYLYHWRMIQKEDKRDTNP